MAQTNHRKTSDGGASKASGLVPGTLVHIGKERTDPIRITVIDYDAMNFTEKEFKKIDSCFGFKEKASISWINIDGIHDTKLIENLGNCYGVHPLVLEDILNTTQRPKLEDFGDYVFIVLKMLYNDQTGKILSEQVSFILGKNYVISLQECHGDVFDLVRERIRSDKGRIRKSGADYLVYSLIDAIVDNYFVILERFGEGIEVVEQGILGNPSPRTLHMVQRLKSNIIGLRKSIWPLREVISAMQRAGSVLIKRSTDVFLRDVYDHTIQVIDTIESYRDTASSLLDIYLSSLSNRMNEVMKVLTLIATIFIPLTFVAGIYGMNFHDMPELDWRWGYEFVWGLFILITVAMIIFFKRRKWL